jgi:hypothetical protein
MKVNSEIGKSKLSNISITRIEWKAEFSPRVKINVSQIDTKIAVFDGNGCSMYQSKNELKVD